MANTNKTTKEEVKETKEETKAETKAAAAKNPDLEEVEVTFPKIRGEKEDIIIIVNGKAWQIKRGHKVKVPRYVLKVYDNSEKSRDEADKYVLEKTSTE